MKTNVLCLSILFSFLVSWSITMANTRPFGPAKKYDAAFYETDGHYWTVLVIAAMLKIQDAKTVAYHAEYPDNIINKDGYCVRTRITFMYPRAQKKVHALTGGDPKAERALSFRQLREATDARSLGTAAHRLGDSFSHTNDKTGRMYPHIIGHMLQWKKPDKIKNNPEKYLDYVRTLAEGMGGDGTIIDMTVFNYVAKAGLTSVENEGILKAEYNLIINSVGFHLTQVEIPAVERYLNERLLGLSSTYTTLVDTDNKKRVTATIVFGPSRYSDQPKFVAEMK